MSSSSIAQPQAARVAFLPEPASPAESQRSSGSEDGQLSASTTASSLFTPSCDESCQAASFFQKGITSLKQPQVSYPDFKAACRRRSSALAAEVMPCTYAAIDSLPSPYAAPETCVPHYMQLQRALNPTVLVVGAGYVGEQLVSCFSRAYQVFALDVSPQRCAFLRDQYATNDNVEIISNVDEDERSKDFGLCLISVPTLLLDDGKTIDTTHITRAIEMVSRYVRPGCTVVIESSVKVGTTRQLLAPLRDRGIYVGFSPERVDPGRAFPLFQDIPKVIAGIDEESLQQVDEYYQQVFTTTVPVPSLETAEMTKLFENCQRLMLISYVNEMADACAQLGIDIHDVCDAAKTKPFGYVPFEPSLGAGGHCIPVNPWYLLADGQHLPVLRQAAQSNKERPIQKAKEIALMARDHRASSLPSRTSDCQPKVLLYGVGFKKGSPSLAYSAAATLADELTAMGINVSYYDEAVTTNRWRCLRSAELYKVHAWADQSVSYAVDGQYDVVVVTQSPSARDRTMLQSLSRCRVVYFAS